MGNADDAALIGDEVLHVDLSLVRRELRQTGRAVLIANLAQLLFDDGKDALLFRENVAQIFDRVDYLFVLLVDLFPLEAGELIKAKIENLIGLMFAERVTAFDQARFISNQDADLLDLPSCKFEGEQFHARFITVGRFANDANELIQIGKRDEITFERFRALLRFA